jgi:regulator of sirC expression with transglutaminase-like and TPR domain
MTNKTKTIILFFLSVILSGSTLCQSNTKLKYGKQTIWDLPKVRETDMNIGFWALVVAKEYDSAIVVQKYLDQLDSFTSEIHRMLAYRTKDIDKVASVITFLYKDGIWNGNRPFSYDLNDPLGSKLENQLLSTYLETRKGNCISMPTLFLALMERVDPTLLINGVFAPLHLFCRVKDRQTGDVWNLETTDKGQSPSNQWYVEKMNISPKAVESGIYLKELSKKEYLAELVCTLVYKYRDKKEWQKALKYAELSLKLNPKSVEAMIQKSTISANLAYEFHEKEQKGTKLTKQETKSFDQYKNYSKALWNKALSLGWHPETKEEREKYLQTVSSEKEKRK